jgi:hypothetical protein
MCEGRIFGCEHARPRRRIRYLWEVLWQGVLKPNTMARGIGLQRETEGKRRKERERESGHKGTEREAGETR